MPPWNVLEIDGGVQFKIKVQPRSGKNEICGLQGDALKIRLTAAPVDGEANTACIRYLADVLRLSPCRIRLMTGQTSHQKIIRVDGIKKEYLYQTLGIDTQ